MSVVASVAESLTTFLSSTWQELVAALVSAVIGSCFAAGRAVLNSMPMARAAALQEEATGKGRDALARYTAAPERIQSRWLVGRVTCTAMTAAFIGDAVARASLTWAAFTAVIGTLLTYGVFTELTTSLARRNPDRAVVILLRVLRPLELLFMPFAAPMRAVAAVVARLVPLPAVHGRTTEHEVEMLLAEGTKAGTLGEERAEMIQNVLEFNDKTAVEVMIPRTSVMAVAAGTPLSQVLPIIIDSGHSRYPVFKDTIDNVIGLLYAKDLFKTMNDPQQRDRKVEQYVRGPVNFVPETQPITELLREMRARRLHMAVVVDDYGGMSGVVTLEDVVEEIVGDIRDEHDEDDNPVQDLGEGRLLVDAAMPLDDLSRVLATSIPDDGDFVSVGGMIVHRAGHVPEAGAELEAYGLKFVVREADERKVSRVEVSRIEAVHDANGSSEPPGTAA